MKANRSVPVVALGVLLLAASAALAKDAVGPQESARELSCKNNLRQMGIAIQVWRTDHDDALPPDLQTLVDHKYLTIKVLKCPCAKTAAGALDYRMVKTQGRTFAEADVVVYDRAGNHAGGRYVLLYNLQVVWLAEEDFKKRMGNEKYE